MTILVVDDEKLLVKGIKFNLENEGYTIDTAFDGREALQKIHENHYDLIILDLMLPEVSGLEVCRETCSFCNTPILMLTAKADEADKIVGFEYGADDYMTKPFSIAELKARIRAILRRSVNIPPVESSKLGSNDFVIDCSEHSVYVRGEDVQLTVKEFDLLEYLFRNAGKVISRSALLEAVWDHDSPGDSRTVDVHIRHLREKIEADPAEPEYILTKWGVGYYFKRL